MGTIKSINPANGKTLASYDALTPGEVRARVQEAATAYRKWRTASFDVRASHLRRLAELLRDRGDDYAHLMASEMGKPVMSGRKEIEKCAWTCEYYAAHGGDMLASRAVETDAHKSYVAFRPLGVVLGIMPWNFPFWQVIRFAVPTLMAGNTVLIKHALNVPGCAVALSNLFADAGFPAGAFETLLIDKKAVAPIIAAPELAGVSLTGSVDAGREVAAQAGQSLKKTVLELGGSDPYLVLDDVDLTAAAKLCVSSRLLNSGQSCISAKRFIVVGRDRARRFEEYVLYEMQAAEVGDPTQQFTEVGPLARKDLRDMLHAQVQGSVQAGAELRLGGTIPERDGWWYPPTVLGGVKREMPAYEEELFGPVAAIICAETEVEAIELANDSSFGLGACVVTDDISRGKQIAEIQLEAGNCFVNAIVRSDPRLPFGGVRYSGFGRELGYEGIREFVNTKVVLIENAL